MPFDNEALPTLSDACSPPVILGTAELAGSAYAGADLDALLARIGGGRSGVPAPPDAAWLYDASIIHQLGFRRTEGLDLQRRALTHSPLLRVAGNGMHGRPLRVLALCSPGDLMVNTPLDFITNALGVRLDLLFLDADRPLPAIVPDHDVAFFAISEAGPALLHRLRHLFALWPRPTVNDPAFLPTLARDALARSLVDAPNICSPTAVAASRDDLQRYLRVRRPVPGFGTAAGIYPSLIRPAHSHAGAGLSQLTCDADLYAYLRLTLEDQFFLTRFVDYADEQGFYCKRRVAFIDRQPYLCHMAVSRHWMVHYLNAGMTESAGKRALEADAMATFQTGFARRHAAAFAALHERLGFDYYSIDCSETRDGRLLVFEADTAAIIHQMDPPDLFPYKPPQMRRVFQAFGAMLERHAQRGRPITAQAVRRTDEAVLA